MGELVMRTAHKYLIHAYPNGKIESGSTNRGGIRSSLHILLDTSANSRLCQNLARPLICRPSRQPDIQLPIFGMSVYGLPTAFASNSSEAYNYCGRATTGSVGYASAFFF